MLSLLVTILTFSLSFSSLAASRVVFIGDTGKGNEGQGLVAGALKSYCQKERCDLGVLAGDNVYPAGVRSFRDPILKKLFDQYYNDLNIPFLVALGNHDYGVLTNSWFRGFYQLEHAKRNKAFHLPHFYYTYETQEAVFAVLDTTRLMWMMNIKAQAQMIKEAHEKARTSGKWFMVVGHHPYLSNGKHGNAGSYDGFKHPYVVAGNVVKSFMEKHVCGKADFYLAGHDHSLQVMDGNVKGCNTQLIVSGSGASTTKVSARNPALLSTSQTGFFALTIDHGKVQLEGFNVKEKIFEKTYLRSQGKLITKVAP